VLRAVVAEAVSFEQAFAVFLERMEQASQDTEGGDVSAVIIDPAEVVARGSVLSLKRLYHYHLFEGRMFAPVTAEMEVSQPIDWVLETLSQWNPVVVGRAVANAYLKRQVRAMEVRIPFSSSRKVIELLATVNITAYESNTQAERGVIFQANKCGYHCIEGRPSVRAAYSIDMMECRKRGEVQTNWIALFDAAKQQMRVVSGSGLLLHRETNGCGDGLYSGSSMPGFKFVEPKPVVPPVCAAPQAK
jgi:hypothetical protein